MEKRHIHITDDDLRRLRNKRETEGFSPSVEVEEKEILRKTKECLYCLVAVIMFGLSST